MAKIDVIDKNNKILKSLDLREDVFKSDVNNVLLYSAIQWQRAKKRSGNSCTKTRSEVNHSTKKPFKQKGTGRARQGMTSSPILVGGGVAFGPKPRDYSYKLNKKMKNGALKSALSYKFKEGKVKIVDSLELDEIKTKTVSNILKSLKIENALIVDGENYKLARSTKNLKFVKYINVSGLNVYDILKHEYLVMTESSLNHLDKITKSKLNGVDNVK